MNRRVHFLVNPRSAGGSVGKNWDTIQSRIRSQIGDFSYRFTEKKGSGSAISCEIADSGAEVLCIVGGDGTISEAVDGIMRSSQHPALLVLNLGTGGDFCKTLGVPGDLHLALQKLEDFQIQAVDVGHLFYREERNSSEKDRYFINIAGCGMAGEVVKSVNRSKKRFGGFSYYLGSAGNLFRYQNRKIRFRLDGSSWMERTITTLAVCNGQYFGGGMRVSPHSEISDGFLDITVIGDWNLWEKVFYSRNFYNGTILQCPKVESFRCRQIEILPSREDMSVTIDCDGEDLGVLPMRVEIREKAVSFLV